MTNPTATCVLTFHGIRGGTRVPQEIREVHGESAVRYFRAQIKKLGQRWNISGAKTYNEKARRMSVQTQASESLIKENVSPSV
jgi:hypothetical protein